MAKAKEDAEAKGHNKAYPGTLEDDYSWSCRCRRWSKSTTRLLDSKRHAEH